MNPIRTSILAALATVFLLASAAAPAKSPPDKTPPGKTAHGAIAVERETRTFGYAYDAKTAKDAKREALKQCGARKCEVITTFRNGCAAVAEHPKRVVAMTGITRDEAETKAMRKCGKDCKVLAWACTR